MPLFKKRFREIVLLGIIALASTSFITSMIIKDDTGKGFAVVELFTSEGCSSCPPADALIAKIQKENNEMMVYVLAYHVDYWNRLGWKDVFSSAKYSTRQSQYASWLKASLYTPQAVVNGSKEFVGSEERTLRTAINNGLSKSSSVQLVLNDVTKNDKQVNLTYQVQEKVSNASVVLALVEKNAETKVLKGENRGLTLSHVQIVRNLETVNLNGQESGRVALVVPEGLSDKQLEIIAFLQNNKTGEIVAATRSAIGNANK